jgi:hypothetical protein
MRFIYIFFAMLLVTFECFCQEYKNVKEINWINTKTFNKSLASFPADAGKDAIVIFANEINTGNIASTIKYVSEKNCLKDIYIFANKLTFSAKLEFYLNGLLDTLGAVNKQRDGGTLFIYSTAVEFLDMSALLLKTRGEFSGKSLSYATEYESKGKKNAGGSGGKLILAFEKISFDEARITKMIIDSVTAVIAEEPLSDDDIDTSSQTLNETKSQFSENFNSLPELLDSDFYQAYKAQVDLKISEVVKKINLISTYSELVKQAKEIMKTFYFDFTLFLAKEALNNSINFYDLNLGEGSIYVKQFSGLLDLGFNNKSTSVTAENFFITFKGNRGLDFRVSDKIIYYNASKSSEAKAEFYGSLSRVMEQYPGLQNFAARWLILLLKDIKRRIETSIKNNDKASLIQSLAYYNSLPDVMISDENLLDSYTGLLSTINNYRKSYAFKVLPLKNNVIEEINNGQLNFYAQPGFTLVNNYQLDNKEKLGIVQFDANRNILQLDFQMKMVPLYKDAYAAQQASQLNKGTYAGIYNSWSIDAVSFSIDGIDNKNSSVTKIGDQLDCRICVFQGSSLPLALLFGNGNFFIELHCHSNLDPDFKFELELPVNFRYRYSNHLILSERNVVKNSSATGIIVNGYTDTDNKLVIITPTFLITGQSLNMPDRFKSIPAEMIENVMAVDYADNHKYFVDLTGDKPFVREIEITNNFPLQSNNQNIFQQLKVEVKYINGANEEVLEVFFTRPFDSKKFKIKYLNSEPLFSITGSVIYENETILLNAKQVKDWNIILDASFVKK